MRNAITSTKNSGLKLAAAGAISAALLVAPATSAVASTPAHAKAGQSVSTGVLSLKGGTTSVKLDPAAVSAMAALGVTLSASAGDGSAAVPVTDTWNASIAQGAIAYSAKTVNGVTSYRIRAGALSLGKASLTASKGSGSMTLGSIGAQFVSGLGGKVNVKVGGGHRIDVLRIDSPAVDAKARIATASLVITAPAARELNKVFSTTSFKAGQKFGTVTVTAPPAA